MNDELHGKLKDLFGIPNKLLPRLKTQLNSLYKKSKQNKKFITIEDIHNIVLDLFTTDYYPIISRNIRIDDNNATIIVGSIAFNMNIPNKMPFLKLSTEDVDLKIYTTSISYLDVKGNNKDNTALNRVLSIFKFVVLVGCMYLKQLLSLIKEYTNNSELGTSQFENTKTIIHKAIQKSSRLRNKSKKQHQQHQQRNRKPHKGGSTKKSSISVDRKIGSNVLNDYKITLQLKIKDEDEKTFKIIDTLELTTMTYSEIFNKIMDVIDSPNILITQKITYNIGKPGTPVVKFRPITFGDSKIVYPSIASPAFFGHYLEVHPNEQGKTLEKLVKEHKPISKIMELKKCGNNCRYMSVRTLLIDTVLMISYADLLVYEKLENGGQVLVPAGFIFKYYKYLVKFIRLFIIKKYYNGTLKRTILEQAKSLWIYALKDLQRSTSNMRTYMDEYDSVNVNYKRFLNEFHQNLFHNRKILRDKYPELMEMADEYNHLVYYINKSRILFKELDDKSKLTGETLESATIQIAKQELSNHESKLLSGDNAVSTVDKGVDADGVGADGVGADGVDAGTGGSRSTKGKIGNRNIILDLVDVDYEEFEMDNPTRGNNQKASRIVKLQKLETEVIFRKLENILEEEIDVYKST